MGDFGKDIGGFIAAIISLAVIAIVISTRANTANVLSSFFTGAANLIGVAISPITGQQVANLTGGGLTGGTWASGSSGASNAGIGGLVNTAASTITGLIGSGSGGSSGGSSSILSGLLGSSGGSGGSSLLSGFGDTGTFD